VFDLSIDFFVYFKSLEFFEFFIIVLVETSLSISITFERCFVIFEYLEYLDPFEPTDN